jgi:hypothetical protein
MAILDEITADEEMDVTSVVFDLVSGKDVVGQRRGLLQRRTLPRRCRSLRTQFLPSR